MGIEVQRREQGRSAPELERADGCSRHIPQSRLKMKASVWGRVLELQVRIRILGTCSPGTEGVILPISIAPGMNPHMEHA